MSLINKTANPHIQNLYPAHSNNYTENRAIFGRTISMIAIHHMAGINTAEQCGSIFQQSDRKGSSHYGIGYDGIIGQYVAETDIAWTNSNWQANCESVTIEVSNSTTDENWSISDESIAALIELIADIAYRNNLTVPLILKKVTSHTDDMYWASNNGTVCYHSQFDNTICPGPTLLSYLQGTTKISNNIISKLNSNFNISNQDTLFTAAFKIHLNMLNNLGNPWKNFNFLSKIYISNADIIKNTSIIDQTEVESLENGDGKYISPITIRFRDKTIKTNCFASDIFKQTSSIVINEDEINPEEQKNQIYKNAELLWILGQTKGLSKASCAGMIGNIEAESGIDPNRVEGIYTESLLPPNNPASQLYHLFDQDDYNKCTNAMNAYTEALFWKYTNQGLSINQSAYICQEKYCAGLGLIQFTGSRAEQLFNYANHYKANWFDLELQLAAIFNLNPDLFNHFVTTMQSISDSFASVEYAARAWLGIMEAGQGAVYTGAGLNVTGRINNAYKWYNTFANLALNPQQYQIEIEKFKTYDIINMQYQNDINTNNSINIANNINNNIINIDLTELLRPYLLEYIIIDNHRIQINNDSQLLNEVILKYIEQKIKEYKNTEYLKINNKLHSLNNNTPILNITNDIITIVKEQTEDKKRWRYH